MLSTTMGFPIILWSVRKPSSLLRIQRPIAGSARASTQVQTQVAALAVLVVDRQVPLARPLGASSSLAVATATVGPTPDRGGVFERCVRVCVCI